MRAILPVSLLIVLEYVSGGVVKISTFLFCQTLHIFFLFFISVVVVLIGYTSSKGVLIVLFFLSLCCGAKLCLK
jgi:hypothetical protein